MKILLGFYNNGNESVETSCFPEGMAPILNFLKISNGVLLNDNKRTPSQ